jgi:mRNA interferase RelE/StbE
VKFRISVSHEAEKVLDRLDRPTEGRLRARLVQLADDPFDPRISAPLTERAGVRKSRVGGWRILFTVVRDATSPREALKLVRRLCFSCAHHAVFRRDSSMFYDERRARLVNGCYNGRNT